MSAGYSGTDNVDRNDGSKTETDQAVGTKMLRVRFIACQAEMPYVCPMSPYVCPMFVP
jgi:hypothetical protein